MFSFEQINNEIVNPIQLPQVDLDKIKGSNLFPELYSNIFLCAKKKSGKTSVIFKIIKSCCGKNTVVIVFCSTVNKDKNWLEIQKWLKKRKIESHVFTSINENGEDQLSILKEELRDINFDDSPSEDEVGVKPKIINFNEVEKGTLKLKRKPKFLAPEYFFIFDDVSTELKDRNVSLFLKTNRHYRSKIIISSQYPNDILPESRKQLDYWLLFAGHSREKLEEIYSNCDLNINFELFVDIYHSITKDKFNFLYIDTINGTFRKNFNTLIKITK